MRIGIANDRAGLSLKEFLIKSLNDFEIIDFGCNTDEAVDYPDYAQKVVRAILNKEIDRGILICGTGIGMSIAANRFKSIRAALCHNEFEARLAREHNDANILCLGARVIASEMALSNAKVFLSTNFDELCGARHKARIAKLDL